MGRLVGVGTGVAVAVGIGLAVGASVGETVGVGAAAGPQADRNKTKITNKHKYKKNFFPTKGTKLHKG